MLITNQQNLSIIRKILLTIIGVLGLLSIIATVKPGVWPISLEKWNVYPDVIFPENCSIHAEYTVMGGEGADSVQLVLENALTNERVSIWNEGHNFDGGYMGNSQYLNNGTPGFYVLKLIVNGKEWASQPIRILNPPRDDFDHTISYRWPQDLMESRVLTARTKIQNVRTTFTEAKDGETLPLVLCTKYIKLSAMKLNQATDFNNGDHIKASINGQDLGTFTLRERTILLETPITLRDGMVLQLDHWHEMIGDTASHFRQGRTYSYSLTFTLVQ